MSGTPVTALGRSVAPGSGLKDAEKVPVSRARHDHRPGKDSLRDVILGGQDGLVNILGIILGVVAGGGDRIVLLSAGFAAAFTESISMGAVGYTSTVEDRDYYAAQQAIEGAAVVDYRDLECDEIRELYRFKGFSGQLLEEVVDTITSNRERWVGEILQSELHLQPVYNQYILRRSGVITLATFVGHLIPLLPFLFLPLDESLVLAVALSAVVLFGVGVYSALTRVGVWWRAGARMLVIGLGAAAIGFAIGRLFNAGA